jgi:EmrB/QacA subfamily drug resistance transporter
MFGIGMGVFTVASAAAALSSSTAGLVAARGLQGAGGALVLPLTLTLLSAAAPPHRRGAVLGIWGAVAGLGISIGPLVGGAIVESGSWQWVFWVNVPIGVVVVAATRRLLVESTGPGHRLDLPGLALVSASMLLIVLGVIRGSDLGWTRAEIVAEFALGGLLLAGFLLWQTRATAPMVPLRLFRDRTFAAANTLSFLLTFGLFGSVFLISQYQQIVQGYGPFAAGLHTVAWTGMPLIVAPIAGALSDRIGGRALFSAGLGLLATGLAWQAMLYTTTTTFSQMVGPFVISGIGMSLFFAPIATSCCPRSRLSRRASPRA